MLAGVFQEWPPASGFGGVNKCVGPKFPVSGIRDSPSWMLEAYIRSERSGSAARITRARFPQPAALQRAFSSPLEFPIHQLAPKETGAEHDETPRPAAMIAWSASVRSSSTLAPMGSARRRRLAPPGRSRVVAASLVVFGRAIDRGTINKRSFGRSPLERAESKGNTRRRGDRAVILRPSSPLSAG